MLASITLYDALIALVVLKTVDVVRLVYNFFFRPGKPLRAYGEWAVVTGATDGIGKAYAFELAKQGLNIMLLSRTEERLLEVEQALKAKYPQRSVDHLAVDFAKFDSASRQKVKAKLQSLEIGVLINNVGLSYPFTKYFHELEDNEIADILEVNMSSATWMTRIVLGDVDGVAGDFKPKDGMLKRRLGAIVNTSSAGGRLTSPLLAEYSGAKAYIERFSMGLAAELGPKGIDVQSQTPLFVVSKMSKIRNASWSVPTPEAYVAAAARQIGYGSAISPWWAHSLQLWFLSLLPETMRVYIVNMQHQGIRKKGNKKLKDKQQ